MIKIKIRGKVINVINETAVVSAPRETACGGNCVGCSGCGVSCIEINAVNLKGAKKEDFVELEVPDETPLLLVLVVFALPLVLIFGSFILLQSALGTLAGIIGAAAGTIIWLWLMYYFNKKEAKKKTRAVIVRIIKG